MPPHASGVFGVLRSQSSGASRKNPSVVTQIVKHLLGQHFAEVAGRLDIVAGPTGFVPNLPDRGKRLWQTFDAFKTHLCQLSSLPLTINDVHAAGTGFSYTDVTPHMAPAAGDGVERSLHDVVVEFESSGRWPDDPQACRRVGTALLLQIREELGTDMGIEADVTEDFLDARYPEFVFRLRIFHPHELKTSAHHLTNFTAQSARDATDMESLERMRALWWRPRIRTSMHAHVLQKPAMAGGVRLCQRWLASQLLSGFEDFAEHLVAAVFLGRGPLEPPSSPQAAVARACWLLDTFDWCHEPFVVDFDGRLTEDERLNIRQSFERGKSDPAGMPPFWICSRYDPHALLLPLPPATVGSWLQGRARRALDAYRRRLLAPAQGSGAGWQELFAIDFSLFDVVVRLRAADDLEQGGPAEKAKKKGGLKAAQERARAMRDALLALVAKLRAHISPVCLVFYSTDSKLVALKWRPSAFLPQQNTALMGAVPHTMLAQGKDQPPLCIPNVLCLTSLVAALAEGLSVEFVSVAGSHQS
eukprot:gnl/TRDRNA2_/TRDRNA2_171239_c0_seq3.p1 gnl/TRDRNA2_/TRDRNA2_171239_c0~~gnl/TRDRNA2_/TRDRNA2_171239_c0_seq3.p1  ORF type:complete len:530 (-),score=100.17 gnl/TRDRNA2_/TRDRNA2_171239_c0_seq3:84-1673(-)